MQLPKTLPEYEDQKQVENSVPEESLKIPNVQKKQELAILTLDKLPPLTEQQTGLLSLPKEKMAINVDAMPLNEFIHMALGDVLGLSFEVDAQVSKKKDLVTLHISHPVDAKRLLGMVEQLLGAYDVFLAESPNGLSVMPFSKASKTVPTPISDQSKLLLHTGRVMTIIPLRYTKAGDAMIFVRHFLNTGQVANATIDTRLNALIIIGMPDKIATYKQAVALIDRPGFADKNMVLIRPVYWQAEELGKELKKLLSAQNIPIHENSSNFGVNILTIEQTNSLVIISTEKKWISLVNKWVETLDTVDAVGEENNNYIYFVKNSKAESLGNIISSVLGGGSSSTQTEKEKDSGATGGGITKKSEKPKKSKKQPQSQSQDLRVVADNERNVLIFTGTARAYRRAYNLLQRLDVEPRQVLIEATVADISLDKSLKLGVDWEYQNTSGNNSHLVGTLNGLGIAAGGLSYVFLNTAAGVTARIRALAADGNAKILSSPRLLTKNNEQASIQVGTQVAVVGSEVSNVQAAGGDNTNLLRSFTYVDTGVILTVTPTILDAGKVELKITQEVSEAGTSTNNTPPIFTRKVDTVLVAESGQTIMIGGLITHNESVQETKIPLLGDIPWLGHIFSNITRTNRITNMVVLITPHIVNSSAEATYLTDKFQQQMFWNNSSEMASENGATTTGNNQ